MRLINYLKSKYETLFLLLCDIDKRTITTNRYLSDMLAEIHVIKRMLRQSRELPAFVVWHSNTVKDSKVEPITASSNLQFIKPGDVVQLMIHPIVPLKGGIMKCDAPLFIRRVIVGDLIVHATSMITSREVVITQVVTPGINVYVELEYPIGETDGN